MKIEYWYFIVPTAQCNALWFEETYLNEIIYAFNEKIMFGLCFYGDRMLNIINRDANGHQKLP